MNDSNPKELLMQKKCFRFFCARKMRTIGKPCAMKPEIFFINRNRPFETRISIGMNENIRSSDIKILQHKTDSKIRYKTISYIKWIFKTTENGFSIANRKSQQKTNKKLYNITKYGIIMKRFIDISVKNC